MRFAALALLIGLGLSAPARSAEPEAEPYIFDVLPLQPYKGNFARLVKGKSVPAWVRSISTQGEGTATPMRSVDVGGTPYRLDRVCKVHDCAGNTLDVLWAPRGTRVWAVLVEGGHEPVMLGEPKPPQAKALQDALASASAPPAALPVAPIAPAAPAVRAPAAPASPTPPK